jgi:hypothetical protein
MALLACPTFRCVRQTTARIRQIVGVAIVPHSGNGSGKRFSNGNRVLATAVDSPDRSIIHASGPGSDKRVTNRNRFLATGAEDKFTNAESTLIRTTTSGSHMSFLCKPVDSIAANGVLETRDERNCDNTLANHTHVPVLKQKRPKHNNVKFSRVALCQRI